METKLWNKNFILACIGNFLMFFSFYLLVPILPIYLDETFDASKSAIGAILSLYALTALMIRPFSGYIVDSFPRKTVLMVCYFAFFIFIAVFNGFNARTEKINIFDNIAKIDDPVGAVSVHMVNGIWGTIAVGLFSTGEDGVMNGLFYGGGAKLLGVQALGIIAIDAYVVVTMFVVFKLIDRVIGLRVPAQVEIDGLDMHEHGLASAYSGFSVSDVSNMVMDVNENTDLGEGEYEKATQAQIAAAVKVTRVTETGSVAGGSAFSTAGEPDTGMHKVAIICRLSKFDELKHALNELGVTGMTMTQVMGCGIQKGSEERYRGAVVDSTLLPKVKVEVIVSRIPVERVIESAKKALYTGHIGDGKIFVYNVMKVIKVRTGEEDFDALQDVE
mgnify:CR=1 FL=1